MQLSEGTSAQTDQQFRAGSNACRQNKIRPEGCTAGQRNHDQTNDSGWTKRRDQQGNNKQPETRTNKLTQENSNNNGRVTGNSNRKSWKAMTKERKG